MEGRDCRGYASKVLETDPPVSTLVSMGDPPDDGVWRPQSVRAVAAATALAHERDTSVERAFLEYPRHGVIRSITLTERRRAAYRRTLRAVRDLADPPSRTSNGSKCESCEYRERCGVRSRTLRSLLP